MKQHYTIKPPRLKKRFLWRKRLLKSYHYTPSDFHRTQRFFDNLTKIVDDYRHRIYFKNGRIKRNVFRDFYSELYYYFVEKGNVHDYHVKKPMTTTFQSNGGIYGWEVNNTIVYIGYTNNFNQRLRQHGQCFMKPCRAKKYHAGFNQSTVTVHLLSITNHNPPNMYLKQCFMNAITLHLMQSGHLN